MVIALGYARSALALSGRRWIVIIIYTQGAASLALGYARSVLAPSGRLLLSLSVYGYGGLKAQGQSIAQGKRSGTLGN